MAEITWTAEAVHWLEQIHEHIASDSPSSAHKVVTGIYQKIQLLRHHIRLGQRYEPITEQEVREILYGHYRIAYLVSSEDRVEIIGIFHAAMDIERYLG